MAVALGAAVATAHGLFEVAVAARVPTGIAWLYPLITDGLALVAYAATARLRAGAARYAWTVVVIAAGLSGLAQATYLAGGAAVDVAPALRFGVGAWPAIAAAVVAHLLYLLATADPTPPGPVGSRVMPGDEFNPATVQRGSVQRGSVQRGSVQRSMFNTSNVQPEPLESGVQRPWDEVGAIADPDPAGDSSAGAAPPRAAASPARGRAEAAALRHAQRHGAWPTVTELEAAAGVSRGTAAAALKALRDHRGVSE